MTDESKPRTLLEGVAALAEKIRKGEVELTGGEREYAAALLRMVANGPLAVDRGTRGRPRTFNYADAALRYWALRIGPAQMTDTAAVDDLALKLEVQPDAIRDALKEQGQRQLSGLRALGLTEPAKGKRRRRTKQA